jgi:hypothetical protein
MKTVQRIYMKSDIADILNNLRKLPTIFHFLKNKFLFFLKKIFFFKKNKKK